MRDIVLMLEQNILAKFKLTPEMQQREERKLVELGGWPKQACCTYQRSMMRSRLRAGDKQRNRPARLPAHG